LSELLFDVVPLCAAVMLNHRALQCRDVWSPNEWRHVSDLLNEGSGPGEATNPMNQRKRMMES